MPPLFLLVNTREAQSINDKLVLPIIPIGIVAYAFTLLWDNLCWNSCICILLSQCDANSTQGYPGFSEALSKLIPCWFLPLDLATGHICQDTLEKNGSVFVSERHIKTERKHRGISFTVFISSPVELLVSIYQWGTLEIKRKYNGERGLKITKAILSKHFCCVCCYIVKIVVNYVNCQSLTSRFVWYFAHSTEWSCFQTPGWT